MWRWRKDAPTKGRTEATALLGPSGHYPTLQRAWLTLTLVCLSVVMAAKLTADLSVPSALSALMRAETKQWAGFTSDQPGLILGAGTVGYVLGKLLVGPVVGLIGPLYTLLLGAIVALLTQSVVAFSYGAWTVSVIFGAWALFSFTSAQAWGAILTILAGWIPSRPSAFGSAICVLSAITELSTVAILGLYALLLSTGPDPHDPDVYDLSARWRRPFYVSALAAIGSAVTIGKYLRPSAESAGLRAPDGPVASPEHPLANARPSSALGAFVAEPTVWLALGAIAAFEAKELSLLAGAPAYVERRLGGADGRGFESLALTAGGKVVALVVAAPLYDAVPKRRLLVWLNGCVFALFGLTLLWLIIDATHAMHTWTFYLYLFFSSLAAAVPWYVPQQVLALHRGGITHVAMLASLMDVVALLVASLLQLGSAQLMRAHDFGGFVGVQLALAAVGATCLLAFVWREWRDEIRAEIAKATERGKAPSARAEP